MQTSHLLPSSPARSFFSLGLNSYSSVPSGFQPISPMVCVPFTASRQVGFGCSLDTRL